MLHVTAEQRLDATGLHRVPDLAHEGAGGLAWALAVGQGQRRLVQHRRHRAARRGQLLDQGRRLAGALGLGGIGLVAQPVAGSLDGAGLALEQPKDALVRLQGGHRLVEHLGALGKQRPRARFVAEQRPRGLSDVRRGQRLPDIESGVLLAGEVGLGHLGQQSVVHRRVAHRLADRRRMLGLDGSAHDHVEGRLGQLRQVHGLPHLAVRHRQRAVDEVRSLAHDLGEVHSGPGQFLHVLQGGIGPHVARRPPVPFAHDIGVERDALLPGIHGAQGQTAPLMAIGDEPLTVAALPDDRLAGRDLVPFGDAGHAVRDTRSIAARLELERRRVRLDGPGVDLLERHALAVGRGASRIDGPSRTDATEQHRRQRQPVIAVWRTIRVAPVLFPNGSPATHQATLRVVTVFSPSAKARILPNASSARADFLSGFLPADSEGFGLDLTAWLSGWPSWFAGSASGRA